MSMEEDKDGQVDGAVGEGGGGDDDIQFISPSNSPTAPSPPQTVSSPLESQVGRANVINLLLIKTPIIIIIIILIIIII